MPLIAACKARSRAQGYCPANPLRNCCESLSFATEVIRFVTIAKGLKGASEVINICPKCLFRASLKAVSWYMGISRLHPRRLYGSRGLRLRYYIYLHTAR